MAMGQVMSRVRLRAAPGRVFLALQDGEACSPFSFAELTPAEAIRIARALDEAARDAVRNGEDAAPLEAGRAPWFAARQPAG
ncbi:hypothetical protein ACI6QG_00555 [Roseococcus sp. DSY-14]|uniref:hypothetical protein n=1 Tax=Roseococcus sp. DSY-14 TaxID=3369650 RepID=UPI00387B5DC3